MLLYFLLIRGIPVTQDKRVKVLTNGSLHIQRVTTTDAGGYECRAENLHGADEISIKLVVQGEFNSNDPLKQCVCDERNDHRVIIPSLTPLIAKG